MAAPELRVKRTIEGIGKWVDVREYLRALEVDTAEAVAAVQMAGLVGRFVVIRVDLEIRGSGAIKIGEVVETLAGTSELPHRAVRFALGTWAAGDVVSPFDLARALPPAPVVTGESALLA